MITHPFTVLRQFDDRLGIFLFPKADGIASDQELNDRLQMRRGASLDQVHGNRTVLVTDEMSRTEKADGMVTKEKNLVMHVRWADCQNFVVFDPTNNVAGMLHCGWRGLIAGAIPEFFRMLNNLGVDSCDAYVGAGPSLCKKCAEFGEDHEVLNTLPSKFVEGRFADLRGAATEQFFHAGIQPERFERNPDCTRCHPETYWTYRGGDRDAVKKGSTNMLACVLR